MAQYHAVQQRTPHPHPNSVNPSSDMDDTARSAIRDSAICPFAQAF